MNSNSQRESKNCSNQGVISLIRRSRCHLKLLDHQSLKGGSLTFDSLKVSADFLQEEPNLAKIKSVNLKRLSMLFNRINSHIALLLLLLVCRIIRVIGQPRGNMLLVGIGGSGRQSLSKLASYILEYKVFMIEVTKHYRKQEFHEGKYFWFMKILPFCSRVQKTAKLKCTRRSVLKSPDFSQKIVLIYIPANRQVTIFLFWPTAR